VAVLPTTNGNDVGPEPQISKTGAQADLTDGSRASASSNLRE